MPNNKESSKHNRSDQAGDALLQKILSDFAKPRKNANSIKKLGEKAWRLILNFRLEQVGALNASQAIKDKIISDTKSVALNWDTDDASLSTVQKIFNRLAAGRYEDAIKLATNAVETKDEAKKIALKENALKGSNKKHESNNKTVADALRYFELNRAKYHGRGGKKRAAIDLERLFPPLKYTTYLQHLKKYK